MESSLCYSCDHAVIIKYKNVDRLIGKQIPTEDIKKILESLEIKIIEEDQANLKLNFYIQKKIVDFPNSYLEEIKKDIAQLHNAYQ